VGAKVTVILIKKLFFDLIFEEKAGFNRLMCKNPSF